MSGLPGVHDWKLRQRTLKVLRQLYTFDAFQSITKWNQRTFSHYVLPLCDSHKNPSSKLVHKGNVQASLDH